MKLPPLTVIEASAGTGKTFTLVTRLLKLVFAGVAPERIVALTFSRLAAGEIFNSFIARLADAAEDPKKAAAESARLGREYTTADFAARLRLVIAHQHLSLIGTLDSFLMRLVKLLPTELGLEGELTVMSDYRSPVERVRLVGEMMMRESEEAKSIFRESFRLAFARPGARSFLTAFADFITCWHARYRDTPEAAAWGEASRLWGAEPPAERDVSLGEIRAAADALEAYREKRGVATFLEAVRHFGGTIPRLPAALKDEPLANALMARMAAWRIGTALTTTRGLYLLMSAYEAAYATSVRRRGLITFDDLPRLLNALPAGTRLPIEYRMDARFDHWALDEFQDTSRGQWQALRNLIEESVQRGEGRSVLIVGDRKQAIYGWRAGDVRILGEQVERAKDPGNALLPLDRSYRYCGVIADAVNTVFAGGVIPGIFDMDHAPAGAVWECRAHTSDQPDAAGFVQVVETRKAGSQAVMADFMGPLGDALEAVRPWARGLTCAVLVRSNPFGRAVVEAMKARGIKEIVFEGDSRVADSPVIGALEELVTLAEHADDAFAYRHLTCSPLGAALWPAGLPSAPEASAALLGAFTRLGVTRFYREVREKLKAVPESWNAFTESRFEDFLRAAAEFESQRDASQRLGDFVDFLRDRKRRDYAEPGKVRVMTIHQSKGLGFDWVLLPLYEKHGLTTLAGEEPLECEVPRWILTDPGMEAAAADPVLACAAADRAARHRYEELCLYYVAMTRAKRALTLLLHPAASKAPKITDTPARFSELVRKVNLQTQGDPTWYQQPAHDPAPAVPPSAPACPRPVRGPRENLRRTRPSEDYWSGLTADRLFAAGFGKAAARGTELHARLAAIEWLDATAGAALPAAFLPAFVKPEPVARVWRERRYELYMDGTWETGQFDRVVFARGGATIYDFKTNRRRADEDFAAFGARLRAAYAPQMAAYRAALARLTGLSSDRIRAVLLLTDTGTAVEM